MNRARCIVKQNLLFFPSGGRDHRLYSLHLSTEDGQAEFTTHARENFRTSDTTFNPFWCTGDYTARRKTLTLF